MLDTWNFEIAGLAIKILNINVQYLIPNCVLPSFNPRISFIFNLLAFNYYQGIICYLILYEVLAYHSHNNVNINFKSIVCFTFLLNFRWRINWLLQLNSIVLVIWPYRLRTSWMDKTLSSSIEAAIIFYLQDWSFVDLIGDAAIIIIIPCVIYIGGKHSFRFIVFSVLQVINYWRFNIEIIRWNTFILIQTLI